MEDKEKSELEKSNEQTPNSAPVNEEQTTENVNAKALTEEKDVTEHMEHSVEESSSEETSSVTNDSEEESYDSELSADYASDKEDYTGDPILEEVKNADFSTLSKGQLLALIKKINQSSKILQFKNEVEDIKNSFYKLHRIEITNKREKFIEEGGNPEDFLFNDEMESEFKEEYKLYRDKKTSLTEGLEKEKQDNLAQKLSIIEEIKNLVNQKESINKTFADFRDLQEKWKQVGNVPQSEIKDLWESYHLAVGQFYDYIKINKELRDLDLKKNLESKLELCEQAESLLIETSIVKAFADLQSLHDRWREIGPVPNEKKNELWERFKAATSQINKRHQEHFIKLKEQEKNNLIAKQELCEKVESILNAGFSSQKDWAQQSDQVVEFQKVWRTIGFAPKKYNNEIYARFRKACDEFFNKKRDFFGQLKAVEEENKQLKIELCIQAEKLQDDTDWKKTTDEFIRLQSEWKKIGPVSRRDSEKLWKRFRTACDIFFNNKSTHYETLDSEQDKNLEIKKALIHKIETFELTEDHEDNLSKLKEFQREWADIGFVPFSEKDKIQNAFRDAINKKFENLNVDADKKKMLKYKVKVENYLQSKNPGDKIYSERSKLANKLKKLQNDIVTLENNIGFFANSNNASSLIKDVELKIEKGKKEIELLKDQIRLLDESEN